jgi:hypothetical protein
MQALVVRVWLIVYDPLVDLVQGIRLSQHIGWNRVDDLIAGYIADIDESSRGLVNYQVIQRTDLDEFPLKVDGFRYSASSYLDVIHRRAPAHNPDTADYHRIVSDLDLLEHIKTGEFDEVWLFGFPYAGFYESRMAGRRAFWCNSPPLEKTEHCPRRFVMMGFSYERGVGEMLEDLGHRAESILGKVFEHTHPDLNLWKRFTLYDKISPGQAEVGTIHFAPNSLRDYDWGNRRFVPSKCDNWLRFPDLNGAPRLVNCAEWGSGDIREHHKWWLAHLPKAEGVTNGISNNWWEYVIRVDHPYFDHG